MCIRLSTIQQLDGRTDGQMVKQYRAVSMLMLDNNIVCLFVWDLTALSAQIGYIAP